MKNRLSRFHDLYTFAMKQSVTMQRRMMFYLSSIIFAAVGFLIFLLLLTGLLFNTEEHVKQVLELQMGNVGFGMDESMDILAGHATLLSKQLTDGIEEKLEKDNIASLNNNPEKLLQLQESMYPILNTTLLVTQSSGTYAFVNATTNTKVENADHSRSGMYLRLVNFSGNISLDPKIIYFRGIPDIARKKKLELHNRWNLEFDTLEMPWYDEQMQNTDGRLADKCFLTDRITLQDTWEKVIYVTCPILGNGNEVYGSCGVEISDRCFRILYPSANSEYGSIFTVLAPIRNNQLILSEGLVGEQSGAYLRDDAVMTIETGKYFDTFETGGDSFIGLKRPIKIKGMGDTAWVVAIMMSKNGYTNYALKIRTLLMGLTLGFVLLMIVLSFFLSNRFVKPIITSLDAIQDESKVTEQNSGISEIDELVAYVNSRKKTKSDSQSLPPNIEDLFTKFENRINTLTDSEHMILDYYIDGHEINEIPDLLFISMSTVRTHNRNIYKKLEVSSRDELMLYLDLLKRCGRIDKIRLKDKPPV